jgi:hypothetical protein
VAVFQHELTFLQSESLQTHVGTIHRPALDLPKIFSVTFPMTDQHSEQFYYLFQTGTWKYILGLFFTTTHATHGLILSKSVNTNSLVIRKSAQLYGVLISPTK